MKRRATLESLEAEEASLLGKDRGGWVEQGARAIASGDEAAAIRFRLKTTPVRAPALSPFGPRPPPPPG